MILSGFSLTAGAESTDSIATPSGINLSELEQFVDDYAQRYIGTMTAGDVIAIVKDGELLLNKAYEYASIENQLKVDVDTVFEWGSATKLLVWTSVMQLVVQGKLDLNRDISDYLPDNYFTKIRFDAPITIYNLMHHNAGWEDQVTDLFYHSATDILSLEETMDIVEPKQVWEPGTVTAYSNYGTALAGYIVEVISGQPFYEYVNESIFAVLNMTHTAIHPYQEDNEFVAKASRRNASQLLRRLQSPDRER